MHQTKNKQTKKKQNKWILGSALQDKKYYLLKIVRETNVCS